MFDTMKIAAIIKQARIDRNMTQMNLADAMGVSYQAVSNWERGNSMPDIGKLEDLCRVLGLTVEQLLGMENPAAAAVQKVIQAEELTVEELTEVAPALSPKELKKQMKAEKKRKKLKVKNLLALAPYMSQADLDAMALETQWETTKGIYKLVPFLSREAVEALVDRLIQLEVDTEDASLLYPFLSLSGIRKLAEYLMTHPFVEGDEV